MNPLASGLPDPKDKRDELRRAAELGPDKPAVHRSLAKALVAKGLVIEARMRRAQQVQPQP